jgi:hypothetical protein
VEDYKRREHPEKEILGRDKRTNGSIPVPPRKGPLQNPHQATPVMSRLFTSVDMGLREIPGAVLVLLVGLGERFAGVIARKRTSGALGGGKGIYQQKSSGRVSGSQQLDDKPSFTHGEGPRIPNLYEAKSATRRSSRSLIHSSFIHRCASPEFRL